MEQKPYLTKEIKVYNPKYGDYKKCKICGLYYKDHFHVCYPINYYGVCVDHDFEEVEEQTYKCGDVFKNYRYRWLLAQVESRMVCLISLTNGNRNRNPLKVNCTVKITENELYKMMGINFGPFKLVKDYEIVLDKV